MLDEYGGRKQIIPAEVKGKFHTRRNYVHFVLMLLFLILPWISINGTQAVLFDIAERRLEVFGFIFLSHDSPLIFFLFAIAILGIMLTTALWGRVWCGWACPQTVFIDAVYRRIEYFIEGNYLERRRLYNSEMTREKFVKSLAKWFLFFVVSSIFAHSFIAYFAGSRDLLKMMAGSPQENWSYFLIVSSVTALLLFNFGWFREQFCIIMCPYGRFQSVLLDQQSLNIFYDQERGEPRKGILIPEGAKRGDCVSCNRCVQVCPTGIDIRHGIQMECIGCTACIDACDEIMTKVNKPTGLISYNVAVPKSERRYFRPRIIAYLALILICLSGFVFNLATRKPFLVTILRGTDAPYQVSPDGSVINHFKFSLHNQSREKQIFEISLPAVDGQGTEVKITQASPQHELKGGESKELHIFVSFPKTSLDNLGKIPLKFRVVEVSKAQEYWNNVSGVGPLKGTREIE